jgi:hypothetical protein
MGAFLWPDQYWIYIYIYLLYILWSWSNFLIIYNYKYSWGTYIYIWRGKILDQVKPWIVRRAEDYFSFLFSMLEYVNSLNLARKMALWL